MADRDKRLAEILANAAPPPPAAANPFLLNQPLEQAAAGANAPLHPIVAAIMQKMGLLNFIRNRGNAAMVDPDPGIPQ